MKGSYVVRRCCEPMVATGERSVHGGAVGARGGVPG